MDYTVKRKKEILLQQLNSKKRIVENINDLLSSDKLTCNIKGFNHMSFYEPGQHTSSNKNLIIEILTKDKELFEQDIFEIKKEIEELEGVDIYKSEDKR